MKNVTEWINNSKIANDLLIILGSLHFNTTEDYESLKWIIEIMTILAYIISGLSLFVGIVLIDDIDVEKIKTPNN